MGGQARLSKISAAKGTPVFAAPEMYELEKRRLDEVDIYSYGVTFGVMLMCQIRGDTKDTNAQADWHIGRSGEPSRSWLEKNLTSLENAQELILRMCQVDVDNRPSFNDILNYPFFTQPLDMQRIRDHYIRKV